MSSRCDHLCSKASVPFVLTVNQFRNPATTNNIINSCMRFRTFILWWVEADLFYHKSPYCSVYFWEYSWISEMYFPPHFWGGEAKVGGNSTPLQKEWGGNLPPHYTFLVNKSLRKPSKNRRFLHTKKNLPAALSESVWLRCAARIRVHNMIADNICVCLSGLYYICAINEPFQSVGSDSYTNTCSWKKLRRTKYIREIFWGGNAQKWGGISAPLQKEWGGNSAPLEKSYVHLCNTSFKSI